MREEEKNTPHLITKTFRCREFLHLQVKEQGDINLVHCTLPYPTLTHPSPPLPSPSYIPSYIPIIYIHTIPPHTSYPPPHTSYSRPHTSPSPTFLPSPTLSYPPPHIPTLLPHIPPLPLTSLPSPSHSYPPSHIPHTSHPPHHTKQYLVENHIPFFPHLCSQNYMMALLTRSFQFLNGRKDKSRLAFLQELPGKLQASSSVHVLANSNTAFCFLEVYPSFSSSSSSCSSSSSVCSCSWSENLSSSLANSSSASLSSP